MTAVYRIAEWLSKHPGATAADIGGALGLDGRTVSAAMRAPRCAGWFRRERPHGGAAWQWYVRDMYQRGGSA